MLSTDPDIRRIMAQRAIESGLLRLKWLAAATRFEIAMRRHDRALKYAYKAGFNPNQPRVPRGQPEGGQWASDGTSSDSYSVGRGYSDRRFAGGSEGTAADIARAFCCA